MQEGGGGAMSIEKYIAEMAANINLTQTHIMCDQADNTTANAQFGRKFISLNETTIHHPVVQAAAAMVTTYLARN